MSNELPGSERVMWRAYADLVSVLGEAVIAAAVTGAALTVVVVLVTVVFQSTTVAVLLGLVPLLGAMVAFGRTLRSRGTEVKERLNRGQSID